MANMPGCRPVATGSTPVRTAEEYVGYALLVVRTSHPPTAGSVRVSHAAQSPDGVIGNTAESESAIPGSSPGLVSMI